MLTPAGNRDFHKILQCGTASLGAEIYASVAGERTFYHTCKSRCCPSCGYRATLLWQEEQKAILPEVRYAGIVFTMPRPLWRIFQDNRHLLHDLPVLGAGVIQQWAAIRYGVCPLILVMPHTFGGDLKFNSHLHILVSAGGLQRSGKWLPRMQFNKHALMRLWRDAVVAHLRRALRAHILKSDVDVGELEQLLTQENERPFWVTYVDPVVRLSWRSSLRRYFGVDPLMCTASKHPARIMDATVRSLVNPMTMWLITY
jgi:Transposase zinc-binding domain/Putative transposase